VYSRKKTEADARGDDQRSCWKAFYPTCLWRREVLGGEGGGEQIGGGRRGREELVILDEKKELLSQPSCKAGTMDDPDSSKSRVNLSHR